MQETTSYEHIPGGEAAIQAATSRAQNAPVIEVVTDAEAPIDVEAPSPKAASANWRWGPLTMLLLGTIVAAIVVRLQLQHVQPDEVSAEAERHIQEEAILRCHQGCADRDQANMQCLQDCLPAKERCMAARCSGTEEGSAEFVTCAIDCHASECDSGCVGIGEIASRCHSSCEPNRNLLLDKACISECKVKHDDSCMDGCIGVRSQCVNTKCRGMVGQILMDCQSRCTLDSCGAPCQETAQAFSMCSSHCYPTNPAGPSSMFEPTSVRSAAVASRRQATCHNMCREYDAKHSGCMSSCGPQIGQCIQTNCPDEKPGSMEQNKCIKDCEHSSCNAECREVAAQVEQCYQACEPADSSACSKECALKYDDSCMQDCAKSMGACMISQCSHLLHQDKDAYHACQRDCMKTHCGQKCASTVGELQQCATKCGEAAVYKK
mmetsp:Transcript_48506/g.113212  ORF Transcript_48506/g.113212 Transcript_48506/m.113212 type:complete len:435 (-) Transcript_48506:286-1590(-)